MVHITIHSMEVGGGIIPDVDASKSTSTSSSSKTELKSSKRKITKFAAIKSSSLRISCKICGDRSSGFHYGVHACEGCKGFFRRTVRLKLKYDICNQMCKIDMKSRNKCQYCRFKKCIELGMSHDAIRFGRMPTVEKEQIIADSVASLTSTSNVDASNVEDKNVRIVCLINTISRSFLQCCSMTKEKVSHVWNGRKALGDKAKSLCQLSDVTATFPNIIEDMQKLSLSPNLPHVKSENIAASSHPAENVTNVGSSCKIDFIEKQNQHKTFRQSSAVASLFIDSSCKGKKNVDVSPCTSLSVNLSDSKNSSSSTSLSTVIIHEPSCTNLTPCDDAKALVPRVSSVQSKQLNINLPSCFGFKPLPEHIVASDPMIDICRLVFTYPEMMSHMSSSFDNFRSEVPIDNETRLFCKKLFLEQHHTRKPQEFSSREQKTNRRLVKVLYEKMQKRLVIGLSEVCEFAKHLPHFKSLDISDQVILVKYGSYEAIFVMMSCMVFGKGILLPLTNIYVSFEFINQLNIAGQMMRSKFKFAEKVAKLELNDVEMSLFVSAIILSSDRPALNDRKKVEKIQEEVLECLRFQLSLSHPHKPRLFATLLLIMTELRQVVAEHVIMVENLREFHEVVPPLIREILKDYD